MSTLNSVLIPTGYLSTTQTTLYTSSGVITIVDSLVVSNPSTEAAAFSINLVNTAGTAATDNLLIVNKILQPKETYRCPEIVGQVLKSGDFISVIATTADSLVIRASGRTIS